MSKGTDYFVNHSVTEQWPFTLYHRPIEERLLRAVQQFGGRPKALNLGCGLFQSYLRCKGYADWSACDIDARAVQALHKVYPEIETFVCQPMPELGERKYDIIVAKEVIEHVIEVRQWLSLLLRALRPGGRLLLSTPNYGISILPVLEYSVLEILARRRGFSRFHIHPTKFSAGRLKKLLCEVAGPKARVQVARESWGMVLFAQIDMP